MENVHTVHHKIHILWSHLQQGIPSTMVLTQCTFVYNNTQLSHTTIKALKNIDQPYKQTVRLKPGQLIFKIPHGTQLILQI